MSDHTRTSVNPSSRVVCARFYLVVRSQCWCARRRRRCCSSGGFLRLAAGCRCECRRLRLLLLLLCLHLGELLSRRRLAVQRVVLRSAPSSSSSRLSGRSRDDWSRIRHGGASDRMRVGGSEWCTSEWSPAISLSVCVSTPRGRRGCSFRRQSQNATIVETQGEGETDD